MTLARQRPVPSPVTHSKVIPQKIVIVEGVAAYLGGGNEAFDALMDTLGFSC